MTPEQTAALWIIFKSWANDKVQGAMFRALEKAYKLGLSEGRYEARLPVTVESCG